MKLKSIFLRNYRNYEKAEIIPTDTFNIIYGNNAQGKTNIIEAVFLCASGRSHRTSKDSELVRYGSDFFEIRVVFTRDNRDEEIQITFSSKERKKIRINEVPQKKIGNLMGHLNAVIFAPEDLLVIKQGPSERRRFMDITMSQLRPSYFYDLQQYTKILLQRNNLLKELAVKKDAADTLDVWDQHLIKTGSRIMKARMDFIKRLDILAERRHERLTNCSEKLDLIYDPSFNVDKGSEYSEIELAFITNLKKSRDKEVIRGMTLVGPHRDDIDIVLNGESTKIYASQGQQRTAVLSMKFAEIDLMKEESGEYPVLLLDDVLSELDDSRKEYLLDNIEGIQTLITSTEKRFFSRNSEEASFFYVENGKIIKE